VLQIFEYVQQDLKKYMSLDKKKNHLPLRPDLLKVLSLGTVKLVHHSSSSAVSEQT
jgi:hypothetical protein